jgi:hypothetical protein
MRKADNCSSKADCLNTYGGFKCNCKPGFTGDGTHCIGKISFSLLLFLFFLIYFKRYK